MDYKKQNLSALAAYFASGCKKEQWVGLELEHFVVDKHTGLSLGYEGGVEQILQRLQPLYGQAVYSQGRIIGIMGGNGKKAHISLEPAAQLEISMEPAQEMAEILQIYQAFIQLLTPILEDMGCELAYAGYHPKSCADDFTLIPKERYNFMETYFQSAGTRGKYMMKGSAATQVSIDYESEADFSKKFRAANILGPLLALICDNSPVFEGKPFKMARTYIWNDVDPGRSMVVKGALDGDFGFYDYARYIYEMPTIFMLEEGKAVYTGKTPVSQYFSQREMTLEDIEHVCSLAFPDVRLKTSLEIRVADSMPIDQALGYTALLKEIFYNPAHVEALHSQTLGIGNREVAEAKAALIAQGAEAVVYNRPALDWIRYIFEMAAHQEIIKPLKEKWL